jgi:ParB-like chromosome segregation protein Spo0J
MKVHQMDPAALVPADYNPRKITDHQMSALKRSLERWGFVEPVVLNERTGRIVGGHQRVAAALELAMSEVPVIKVTLDEDAEKALNIALNKISGEWDEVKLGELLSDLDQRDWDLPDLGFEDDELADLLAFDDEDLDGADTGADLTGDLDELPAAPKEPITKAGDVWLFDPRFECDGCDKVFSVEQAQSMAFECDCDG